MQLDTHFTVKSYRLVIFVHFDKENNCANEGKCAMVSIIFYRKRMWKITLGCSHYLVLSGIQSIREHVFQSKILTSAYFRRIMYTNTLNLSPSVITSLILHVTALSTSAYYKEWLLKILKVWHHIFSLGLLAPSNPSKHLYQIYD